MGGTRNVIPRGEKPPQGVRGLSGGGFREKMPALERISGDVIGPVVPQRDRSLGVPVVEWALRAPHDEHRRSDRANARSPHQNPRHSGMRHLAQARNPYSRSWLWIPGSRCARPGMTTWIAASKRSPLARTAEFVEPAQVICPSGSFVDYAGVFSVIPGRAQREPGIHNHDREYGFRACAKWRIPE